MMNELPSFMDKYYRQIDELVEHGADKEKDAHFFYLACLTQKEMRDIPAMSLDDLRWELSNVRYCKPRCYSPLENDLVSIHEAALLEALRRKQN